MYALTSLIFGIALMIVAEAAERNKAPTVGEILGSIGFVLFAWPWVYLLVCALIAQYGEVGK